MADQSNVLESHLEAHPPMRVKMEANDGTVIEVDIDVARKSLQITKMLEDLGIEDNDPRLEEPLPVTAVNGRTLSKIMGYCLLKRDVVYKEKDEAEDPKITLTAEDEAFMDVPREELLEILNAADFLNVPEVIDIITQKIANMALGKSVEEMRQVYGLKNDYTEEEEEELREKWSWVLI